MAHHQPLSFQLDQGFEYYSSKTELLDWVNGLLGFHLTRLEQFASGAIYCQMLDAFSQDLIPIRKVNFAAREEYEILPNFKLLQAAFGTLGYTKELEVLKLCRASNPDNLELLQWLFKKYKGASPLPGYDPAARRHQSARGPISTIPLPACVTANSFDVYAREMRISGTLGTAIEMPRSAPPKPSRPAAHATPGGARPATSSGSRRTGTPNNHYQHVSSRYREGLAVPSQGASRKHAGPTTLATQAGARTRRVRRRSNSTQTDFPDEEYEDIDPHDAIDNVGAEVASSTGRHDGTEYGGSVYDDELYDADYELDRASEGQRSSAQHDEEAYNGFGSPAATSTRATLLTDLEPAAARSGAGSEAASAPTGRALGAGAAASRADEESLEDDYDRASAASHLGANGVNGDRAHGSGSRAPSGFSGASSRAGYQDELQEQAEEEIDADGPVYGNSALAGGAAAAGTAAAPAFGSAADRAMAADDDSYPPDDNAAGPSSGRSGDEDAPAAGLGVSAGDVSQRGDASDDVERINDEDIGDFDDDFDADVGGEEAAAASGRDGDDGVHDDVEGNGDSQPDHDGGGAGTALAANLELGRGGASAATQHDSTADGGGRAAGTRPGNDDYDDAQAEAGEAQRQQRSAAAYGATTSSSRHGYGALPPEVLSLLTSTTLQPHLLGVSSSVSLVNALDVCQQALDAVQQALGSLRSLLDMLAAGCPNSCTLCGKTRSLQDALQTLLSHTTLLLSDVQAYSGGPASTSGGSGNSVGAGGSSPAAAAGEHFAQASALLQMAKKHDGTLHSLTRHAAQLVQLQPSSSDKSPPAGRVPEQQRLLSSTTHLDNLLKAVGLAQFALVQGVHRERSALTASFFKASPDHTGGRKTRAFKLGEYQLKQLRNGDIYKGRYINSKKNGEGVYEFINLDTYEGEFRDDRMDGYGVYTFSHEGRYEGQWKNAVYNGTGAETFAKGSTYRGEYAGGLRNGWGVCRFFNGDYYEGLWVKGLRDGSGMQQCTDDSNYVGDYVKGKRHGHGVYSFPNGDRYEGQYQEDLPHGYGVYHFASGQCYQGQWHLGKKHGWSIYSVDNGSKFMGLWSEGKPTWVHPLGPADSGGGAAAGEEDAQRRTALVAQSDAAQAAATARQQASSHWDATGSAQGSLQSSTSRAQASATMAQQVRRKACELGARLDAAIALLQSSSSSGGFAAAASPVSPNGAA